MVFAVLLSFHLPLHTVTKTLCNFFALGPIHGQLVACRNYGATRKNTGHKPLQRFGVMYRELGRGPRVVSLACGSEDLLTNLLQVTRNAKTILIALIGVIGDLLQLRTGHIFGYGQVHLVFLAIIGGVDLGRKGSTWISEEAESRWNPLLVPQ
jgi:hypothetical protein